MPESLEDEERFTVFKRQPTSALADADWRPRPPASTNTSPPAIVPSDSEQTDPRVMKRERWILLRRGHLLSFAGLFLFTVLLYFRPYELFPNLAYTKGIAYWVAAATLLVFLPSQFVAEGNLTARPREVNLVLLLTLAALLSVPLAIDRPEAWQAFTDYLKVVLMFIVMVNVMRTRRRMMIIMLLSLAVGCLVSVGAINAYHLGLFTDNGQRVKGLIGGMFENSNDMALHLVIMTPLASALIFSSRNIFIKLLFAAMAVLMIAGNVVTLSRGGLLGLTGALGVLLWKLGSRHRLLVFGLALSIVFSLIVFMPGMMIERIASIYDPSSDMSASGSALGREALLYRSIVVMLRHPLLGVGMGNFHNLATTNQVTHNAYTQIGADVGIPAMVLYTLFILAALKRTQGIEQETLAEEHHSHYYYLSIGLQASLIGYMISSFFLSVGHLPYLYYLVGYAVCLHRIYEARTRPVIKLAATTEQQTKSDAGAERNWRLPLSKPESVSSQ